MAQKIFKKSDKSRIKVDLNFESSHWWLRSARTYCLTGFLSVVLIGMAVLESFIHMGIVIPGLHLYASFETGNLVNTF